MNQPTESPSPSPLRKSLEEYPDPTSTNPTGADYFSELVDAAAKADSANSNPQESRKQWKRFDAALASLWVEDARIRTENERIVADTEQCHSRNDELVGEHILLRKQIAHMQGTIDGLSMTSDTGERRERWVQKREYELAAIVAPQPPVCKHCGKAEGEHTLLWHGQCPEPKIDTDGKFLCFTPAAPGDVRPVEGGWQERTRFVGMNNDQIVSELERRLGGAHAKLNIANARIAELDADRISMILELGEVKASLDTEQKQNAAMHEALNMARDSYELARLTKNNPTYSAIVAALSPSAGNHFVRRTDVEPAVQQLRKLWEIQGNWLGTDVMLTDLTRAESALKPGGQEG